MWEQRSPRSLAPANRVPELPLATSPRRPHEIELARVVRAGDDHLQAIHPWVLPDQSYCSLLVDSEQAVSERQPVGSSNAGWSNRGAGVL
jgi:hypothetical protein